VYELRVRYGECDPQGIVFNANYLLYFDVAFTELWREAIGSWTEMVDRDGVDAVVAEANIRFRAPARYDEVIELHARLARLEPTSIATEIDVVRDGQVLVQGRLEHVFVDTSNWKRTEMPDRIRSALEPYTASNA
jgi:acyl-CoA thioester hydrolase